MCGMYIQLVSQSIQMGITEKPRLERVKETVEILRGIQNLGIPLDSPEVAELRTHMDAYVKDGICWSGSVSFLRFGRIADVNLPKRADKAIEVTLRVPRIGQK
jgi:hypothetical protein